MAERLNTPRLNTQPARTEVEFKPVDDNMEISLVGLNGSPNSPGNGFASIIEEQATLAARFDP
jgi:hypothetical protein